MVGCQGQPEKLNFPRAVMQNRIYSKTHLLDGWNKAAYSPTPRCVGNRLDAYVSMTCYLISYCKTHMQLLLCVFVYILQNLSRKRGQTCSWAAETQEVDPVVCKLDG